MRYDTFNANSDILPDGTWALVDSSEGSETVRPCGTFRMASRVKSVLIVQVTSLITPNFKSWTVEGRVLPYVMDAFSPLELLSLGLVQPTIGSVPSR